MPINSIAFNPMVTTNARSTFSIISDGYVQGVVMDDPAARFSLKGGVNSPNATVPLFGGNLITTTVTGGNAVADAGSDALGPTLTLATAIAGAAGFTAFNQSHNLLNTPQSPVPSALASMSINFHRFGSGARIALAIDPNFAASLVGGLSNQSMSWDYTTQTLVPFVPATAQIAITSLAWAAGVVTVVTAAAHPYAVGDHVTISGAVPAGYNGDVVITSVADTTHFTYVLATNPGAETTPGVILASGGLLPVVLEDINIGNSMTVHYDPVANAATWNPQGSTALVTL